MDIAMCPMWLSRRLDTMPTGFLQRSVVFGWRTSASTPSFASLFAIVNQKYNGTQGNINPALYPLAIKQAQGGAAVFHDITSGNNTVPGVSGYAAGVGYDMASGTLNQSMHISW